MSEHLKKNLQLKISLQCWKELRKMSIDDESSLSIVAQDILEKYIENKLNKLKNKQQVTE